MENEPTPVEENESMSGEESEHVSDEQPTKKFTPFQWAVMILLGVLVLVLVGFFVVYALKKSDNDRAIEEEAQKTTTTSEDAVDTNVKPPSVPSVSEPANSDETVTNVVKKPDLYVKSYDLGETPRIGDEFTAKIVVGNKGTIAAGGFSWEWWPTSSGRDCKGDIDSLAVGGTKLIECEYTYDETDEYSTKFIVDSKDDVNESDENNNVSTKKINVAEKADLYVSDYDFNHDPVSGEEFTVRIKIKNKGETDAEDFYWEWWGTVTGSRACREKIDILKAGDSETVECDYTYGGWADYTTKAVVDSDTDVDESDEGNNTYTKNVIPIH
ncbi:MAG: CARDB domain-containing protein [Parcubacteria group bacterium]|jgi:hypothetical protein